jgi:HIRAN domain-containing protein
MVPTEGFLVILVVVVVITFALRRTRHTSMRSDASGDDARLAQPERGRSFRLGVAGESYDNPDGTSQQSIIRRCRVGEPVQLIRDPDNQHDMLAVKVCRQSGEQIGHLPRGHGLWRKIMDGRVSAVIDGVHGGTRGKPSRGVVLAITVRD